MFTVPKIKAPSNYTYNASANKNEFADASVASNSLNLHLLDVYKIDDSTVLGTGSFGIVCECVHRFNGIKCAVKSIDKKRHTAVWDIKREINILQSIHHPNIMKMHDSFENESYLYIITELYTGGDLFDYVVN